MTVRFFPLAFAIAGAGCTVSNTETNTDTEVPAPECGNGVVEEDEACDAAGEAADCNADCTDPVCGDDLVNAAAGEVCEPGLTGDNATCGDCAAVVCEEGFDDCDGDATNGCEVLLCGGTCDAPGGSATFVYTGAIEAFEVPDCASTLTVEAWGAQGGGGPTVTGGLGAYISGTFTVDGSEALDILVGGAGADASNSSSQGGGSGGGGSFVVGTDDTPWVIAGGGGGALYSLEGVGGNPRELNGGPGQITEAGQAGDAGGAGGTEGNGGETWAWTGWHSATGGGGFLSSGSAASNGNGSFGTANQPGTAFLDGGAGGLGGDQGRDGGFGGGGSAGFTGGGGGGYSGGG